MSRRTDTLNPIAREFLNRLRDSIERTSAMGRLSGWMTKNMTLAGQPYSFKGHEYQVDIADDEHPNSCIIKPSQTGLSELAARLALAFLAVSPDSVAIYTLPTVNEALRFSKSRMDPVIRSSEYLSSIMLGGSDSSSFKQIGSSQLFMAGTFGKALISIPTDFLLCDEVDFSNPEVLVTAESRLSHSRIYNEELDMRGIRRKFSTPTLPRIGVSALYDASDQCRRLVRCKNCYSYFWPNFLHHVVVPGYDGSMEEISYIEVQELDSRGLIDKAQLLCPYCHHQITRENLGPEYREWVAEFPSVKHQRGWAVTPFDLPDYHTPASILRKKLEYKEEEGHFRNFTLGLAYSDSSNSVIPGVVSKNSTATLVRPDSEQASGTVMALDVGKTSWLLVGKPRGEELDILWAEQIRINANDEDSLFSKLCQRMKDFKVVKCVVDALPYTDTMLRFQKRFLPGQVLLCTYTLTDRKTSLFSVRDKDYVVEANRTKTLDVVVRKLNTDKIKFPPCSEAGMIEAHLQGMKRVERLADNGEVVPEWVKSGPDHYFHTLNYLNMAARMVETSVALEWAPHSTFTQAFIGAKVLQEEPVDPLRLFSKPVD